MDWMQIRLAVEQSIYKLGSGTPCRNDGLALKWRTGLGGRSLPPCAGTDENSRTDGALKLAKPVCGQGKRIR